MYHLKENGEVGVCKAKVQKCPLGGEHFNTKDLAQKESETYLSRMFFEAEKAVNDLIKVRQYFSLKGGDIEISEEVKQEYNTKNLSDILCKVFYSRLSSLTGEEGKNNKHKVLLSFALNSSSGNTKDSFRNAFIKFVELSRSDKPVEIPVPKPGERFDIHGVQMGTPDRLNAFKKILKKRKRASDDGFKFIGEGMDQVAFLDTKNNEIYKVPIAYFRKNREGDDEETYEFYMKDQILGITLFPKLKNIRHAHTSVYNHEGLPIIIQERALPKKFSLSEDDSANLLFCQHDDLHDGNYGVNPNNPNEALAFDTSGIYHDEF